MGVDARVTSQNPIIFLPFPSSLLSGHAKGNWREKSKVTKQHRNLACEETILLKRDFAIPRSGDIKIDIHFHPPDRRSDRVNFAARMKPYIDGVADALGFNDVRLLPQYHFHPADKDHHGVKILLERRDG